MKKLSPVAYRSLFIKHVGHFLEKIATVDELKGNHAVAVSGGLDSMTLLWFAQYLYREGKIGKVRAIFVNHNTRSGQARDALLVKKFCKDEGIPFVELSIEGLSPFETNFETKARRARRSLCLEELENEELLWVGHHLDDSFEWNFMQRNRSTNPRSTIGIPVRNNQIIRPFNCVTRAQIKKLAKFEDIPYRDDPTNWDTKYDRNYVRHKIVPLIKARYPKYLKFYSHFANFSAMALKLSLIGRSSSSRLFVFEEGAALVGKIFSEIQIQELIHTYSSADRGKIVTPIQRMIRAIDHGKKGPFHFSGGMEAYYTPGLLMIYKNNLKNYDQSIARVLSSLSINTLKTLPGYRKEELEEAWGHLLQSPDALLNLPGPMLVLESESICKTLNTSSLEPMFPKVSEICRERGLKLMTMRKCLDVWTQKKEKLPETLKIVPLFNLSNLFTFQD
jgi:tRNA(Ile)-lysidine synthetase-like protein